MLAHERLLKYVQVSTPSDDKSTTNPTTACQFDLANVLVEEMKELGITDARVDDKCYVYGTIPATEGYVDEAITKATVIDEHQKRLDALKYYGNDGIVPSDSSLFTFDSSTGTILGYSDGDTDIVIPYEIDGVSVTNIGDAAFYGCINLISSPELPATTLAESCYNNMF